MSKSKAKGTITGVSSDQAALIHELLGECFETSLRQQLMAGEFNAAILGKVLEYLKHNNISVVEEADSHLASLAAAFRADSNSNDSDDYNFFASINASEI
ncbi:hypothetical protein SynSYN20_01737 [Synechococcus sp. SYN20]|uniref:hypothetical protein n=1 Tax=Synechococcus sp. SYN20 TaxID=1050714 RepID=UPI001646D508|nr:hypothetical protein [Synechococcus sp. SYN20]QNJ26063.1 hypothetical protein SynSYN20_01737 [Synechococcus sp. SYN20]